MSIPAVQIENITKIFPVPLRRRRIMAVRNLSLTVQPGEVYGLLGPNGCGKSTTLKMLLGLVKPNHGRALICGKDSREYRSRRDVGFLPENPYFYKFLTATETLVFYGRICGMRGSALKKRAEELIDLVGLSDARDRRVAGFSKGMLQRIGLAQAILHRPDILFLDEPTSGLDPLGIKTLRDLIIRLNKERGTTIFMNTHLISEVSKTCTSIGVLNHGQLVFHDKIAEVLRRFGDDTALEHLYLSLAPAAEV